MSPTDRRSEARRPVALISEMLPIAGSGRTPFTDAQAKIRETLEAEQKATLLAAELAKVRKKARVWTIWDGDLNGDRLVQVLGDKQKR